eukprot:TRINITY_DN15869_c0_g1_i1.p1 TRINITY_DN15869_c0_g1~~TRINITY_DN15869_c0_g1_i1.p1  ORF type:complete len:175 (+),score=29.80 TRINITY_DN15869_c0_g1_i1:80-604(+)
MCIRDSFNSLLEEMMEIVNACISSGLISFTSISSSNVIEVSKLIPIKAADEMRRMIIEAMKFMWSVILVLASEEQTAAIPESKLKLAVIIIRLSHVMNDEQQKLEFLQQGVSLLKSIPYESITVSKESVEEVKSLANALELYLGKWDSILKLSLIHICRCRRYAVCRSRWSPYH